MEKKSKFLILLIFSKGTNSNQEININNYNNQNLQAVPGPTLMKKTTMGDKYSLKKIKKREENKVTNDIRF